MLLAPINIFLINVCRISISYWLADHRISSKNPETSKLLLIYRAIRIFLKTFWKNIWPLNLYGFWYFWVLALNTVVSQPMKLKNPTPVPPASSGVGYDDDEKEALEIANWLNNGTVLMSIVPKRLICVIYSTSSPPPPVLLERGAYNWLMNTWEYKWLFCCSFCCCYSLRDRRTSVSSSFSSELRAPPRGDPPQTP